MNKIIVCTFFLVMAAAFAGTESGTTELSVSFIFLKPEEGDYTQVLAGQVGFFAVSWLEVSGKGVWFGPEGNTKGAAGGGIDIHLAPHQEIVPYVGAGLLASIGNEEMAEDTMLDFHIGVKYFVGGGASINYTLQQWRDTSPARITYFVGMIGVSVYL